MSLKDQLLKAGLVSKKQARRATHEQRVDNKKKGREGAAAEKRARAQRHAAEVEVERVRNRARADLKKQAEADKAARSRVAQIVDSGIVPGAFGGPRRFYFVTRDGRVPYVDIGDETALSLERGAAAIAESPNGALRIITADAAARVVELDPQWVRAWRRGADTMR